MELGTQVPQTDWHSGGTWVYLSICGSWCNGGRQLGALCWLGKHKDPHTVPSDVCLAMNIYSPKQRNGDPLCGTDMPLDIVHTEFLGYSRVRGCRWSNPLSVPPASALLQGSWSNPDITAMKWTCFQVMVALTSSPFVIIPITLSIILNPTMTGTFLE